MSSSSSLILSQGVPDFVRSDNDPSLSPDQEAVCDVNYIRESPALPHDATDKKGNTFALKGRHDGGDELFDSGSDFFSPATTPGLSSRDFEFRSESTDLPCADCHPNSAVRATASSSSMRAAIGPGESENATVPIPMPGKISNFSLAVAQEQADNILDHGGPFPACRKCSSEGRWVAPNGSRYLRSSMAARGW
jgi:hypothetical protein